MRPKEILCQWVDAFNNADVEIISSLYDDNATNHQVANEPVMGREATSYTDTNSKGYHKSRIQVGRC